MAETGISRRLRGGIGNALVWGAGWSAAGFAVIALLRVTGVISGKFSWLFAVGMAIKFGIIGVAAGGAFAGLIRLLYRGRRLSEINWVRFGLVAGVATGLFVPLFLQMMNLLSGDGLVPWNLVLDDGVWASVFGAAAAGGSLRLAQRAERALSGGTGDQAAQRMKLKRSSTS